MAVWIEVSMPGGEWYRVPLAEKPLFSENGAQTTPIADRAVLMCDIFTERGYHARGPFEEVI